MDRLQGAQGIERTLESTGTTCSLRDRIEDLDCLDRIQGMLVS